eukprot:Clim_evm119s11 gene=Clim_evmTU119s11
MLFKQTAFAILVASAVANPVPSVKDDVSSSLIQYLQRSLLGISPAQTVSEKTPGIYLGPQESYIDCGTRMTATEPPIVACLQYRVDEDNNNRVMLIEDNPSHLRVNIRASFQDYYLHEVHREEEIYALVWQGEDQMSVNEPNEFGFTIKKGESNPIYERRSYTDTTLVMKDSSGAYLNVYRIDGSFKKENGTIIYLTCAYAAEPICAKH